MTPLLTLLVLFYFGFHALSGQYGLRAHYAFAARETELAERMAQLSAVRAELEARVLLLRDGTIERDMLDERARRTLNLAHKDEIVIDLY